MEVDDSARITQRHGHVFLLHVVEDGRVANRVEAAVPHPEPPPLLPQVPLLSGLEFSGTYFHARLVYPFCPEPQL